MKRVVRLIKKVEKIFNLAEKNDIYTIHFSNEKSLFFEKADAFNDDIKEIADYKDHPIWSILISLVGIKQTYPDSCYLRFEVTRLILQKLGLFTFYTHISPTTIINSGRIASDQVSLAIVNLPGVNIQEILDEVNEIYKRYFDDSIIIKSDKSPLKELKARIEYSKNNFLEQLPWLEIFQEKMLDDISKVSFSHFLYERIGAQLTLGDFVLYPISAPKITDAYRAECINKYLSFPSSYTLSEASEEYCLFNEQVKAKKPFPEFIGVSLIEIRFFQLATFILEQYGIPDKFEAQKGDVVIDAGAYIGDTAIYFSQKIGTSGKGKIYAFEPILQTIEFAKENLKRNHCDNVEVIPFALSDKNELLHFEILEGIPLASAVQSNDVTEYSAEAIRLDDFVQQNNIPSVDFIKMDIEGAEMAALEGAKETIRRFKPDCAIALYHKKNDYWDIPHFLLEQCPEYKFYFRCDVEPVLFATVRQIN